MIIPSKLPHVGTNIFSVMSLMAKEHNAINLSQGFPDFPISSRLTEEVYRAMKDGHNQYAPMPGVPVLREILAEKINALYACNLNPETEITITPGATYAIYNALATILQPLDEVIVLEPAYDSYIPNIEVQGAIAIKVPLSFPSFSVDWDLVRGAINHKTKAIIINTPHNPTGYVFTKEDMLQLEKITSNTQIFIISDEVYEHITFDELKHESVMKYPSLLERSFVCFSFGKVFHTTGWKMGYCIAPSLLMNEFRKMHQFMAFSCNTPMQMALAAFLQYQNEYLELPDFFQKKRDLFLELLKDLPFTLYEKTNGSYFQLMSYDKISDKNDKEFTTWLTKEIGVATIPMSAFYHNAKDDKLIRFCFAKKDETLILAAEKLKRLK